MEMLKKEEYVTENLPVRRMIRKAKKIENTLIKKHLKKVEIDNWYKNYFEASEDDQVLLHERYMTQL